MIRAWSRVPPIDRRRAEIVRAGRTAPPVPLNIWDHGPGHNFVRCAWFFEDRVDAARVRAGLAGALRHFPMLAGRLRSSADHGLRVACNDAGASFCEAYEPHPFEPLGPSAPGSDRLGRYIEENPGLRVVDRDCPLASVQVTQLATGGSIVGVGVCHTVADGESYFRFVEAVGRACRGEAIDGPSIPQPSWEPSVRALVAHPDAAVSAHMRILSVPRLIAAYARVVASIPTMATGVLRFSKDDINALKAEAAPAGGRCSTNDVVTGYVWQQLVRLRGEDGRADDRLHMALNARGRVPSIPSGYFGNAVTLVTTGAPRNTLAREPFAQVVRRVRGMLDRFGPTELAVELCAIERCVRDGTRWRGVPRLMLECFDGHSAFDSWAKFPLYQFDFGSGPPRWVIAPAVPIPQFSLILPSGEDGGVDVSVNLRRADWSRLQRAWRRELDGWHRRRA